jgi:iron(III) transport system substrate-binding protein
MAAAAVLVLLGAAACGSTPSSGTSSGTDSGWSSIVSKANTEGTVNWWSENTAGSNQRVITAFQTAYPSIKVNLVQGTPAVLEPKYQQVTSANLSGPDVFSIYTSTWITDQVSQGALVKPQGPDVKTFPATGILNGGYSLVVNSNPQALAWNTNQVPGGLKTYADLLDPKLKGHLAIWAPTSSITFAAWSHIEAVEGPTFLSKLAAQGPFHFFISSAPLNQSLASGESWAAMSSAQNANAVEVTGAPIKWAYSTGDQPQTFVQYGVQLKKADHPNAATVFEDFLISRAGQEAVNGAGLGLSLLSGVSGALPSPPNGVTQFDPTKWTADQTATYKAHWNSTFNYNG